jgi:hypothetical protein
MGHAGMLHDLIASLSLGAPKRVGDLDFVPIFVPWSGVDADLLEEAIGRGQATVSEVDEHGRVNTVRVKHGGARLLLLVDGEQVVGAKQNRVFNASFLVPPGAAVDVPVSCVERRRWDYQSPVFQASGTTLASDARADKLRRVTKSVRAQGTYDADQGAVWQDVDAYLERTRVGSMTAAFNDAYASRARDVERRSSSLAPAPGQVGLAAVRGSTLVGLDLFGSPSLFARGWSKVARGLLAEVYATAVEASDPMPVVRACLHALAGATVETRPAPGCGSTLHAEAAGYVAGGVALQQSLYHLLVVAA